MSALAYRHQRVQRLRRLLGRRSARREEGRFVVEGVNLLEEALASGVPIEAVFVDELWSAEEPEQCRAPVEVGTELSNAHLPSTGKPSTGGPSSGLSGLQFSGRGARADETGSDGPGSQYRLAGLLERCFDSGARVFELESGVMARVAGTVSPQPVMAIVSIPEYEPRKLRDASPRLVLVCVEVRDPGNAGTVARSAWAAGADAVVCCEGTVDMWNPKCVRSSAGAVLHVPVLQMGPAQDALAELGHWGLRRWGTVVEGGLDYARADLTPPCAVVFGNEAGGLPLERIQDSLDGLLSIPMPGGAESLNVGMAAAVICFEAARQRRMGRPGGTGH